jgi:hypothetical protein
LLGEVSLGAVSAGVGITTLDVAVLAAVDVFVRADCDVVGATEGVVIGGAVDHGRLAALEAAGEQRGDQQKGDEGPWGVPSHNLAFWILSSLPGLTRQSIKNKAFLED